VADGRWHAVDCVRAGGRLSVLVDGTTSGSVAVPGDLSVVNDTEVSIGGKGTTANNDQFSGAIDDVYLEVDP
jgi:hypothetical protein